MSRFNTWKLQLEDWAASEDGQAGDKALSLFVEATDPSRCIKDRIRDIWSEEEAVILGVKEVESEGIGENVFEVRIFHSPKNMGGTRCRPLDKLIALEGLGHEAPPVLFDPEHALKAYKANTPKPDAISACDSPEAVAELEPPAGGSRAHSFHCSGLFLLAPHQALTVIKRGSVDPKDLILALASDAESFDSLHDEDEEYPESAVTVTSSALRWLWLVSQGVIDETKTTPAITDPEAVAFKNRRHLARILPPFDTATGQGVGNPPPQDQNTEAAAAVDDLAGIPAAIQAELRHSRSVSHQAIQVMAKMSDVMKTGNELSAEKILLMKEKHEKKTNRVAKLHENCIKTLLFAAASDDSTVETELADSANAFFNAESAGKAEQELSNQFSKLKVKKVAFSSGTSKSLYEGQLFWDTDISPMNLSVFMFWKPGCSEPSMNGRFLVLHSLEKAGKVVSAEEVKKALKQGIVVPQTYHGMFEQMERHKTALQIFCGKSGHLPTKYIELLDSVKELQDKFEEGQARNPQFVAGFMYLVDVRVHEFLKSCYEAEKRNEVRNSLLNWRSLLERVELQEFAPNLPSSFKLIEPSDSGKTSGSDASKKRTGDNSTPDKPSKKPRDLGQRVQNPAVCEELKLERGEKWRWFKHPQAVIRLPKWKGSQGRCCHHFLINGQCFEKCPNKESHVPRDQVPETEKASLAAWMAEVRSRHS
jgi:hypothetical protein